MGSLPQKTSPPPKTKVNVQTYGFLHSTRILRVLTISLGKIVITPRLPPPKNIPSPKNKSERRNIGFFPFDEDFKGFDHFLRNNCYHTTPSSPKKHPLPQKQK